MKKVTLETSLRDAIIKLETQQAEDGKILREHFYQTIDSLKPINLIKNTFKDAVASRELKGDILTTSVGLTAGLISKIVFAGVMKSQLRKLIGTALMFGITNLVARNPEVVRLVGKSFFSLFKRRTEERVLESAALVTGKSVNAEF